MGLADSTGLFNITGSPVMTAGTLTLASFQSQTANTFLAAPNGSSGAPTFRTIVAADVPTLNQNTTGTASNVSGTVLVGHGGTGDTSFTAYSVITGGTTSTGALQSVASVGTTGQVLTSNGASALPTFQAPAGNVAGPGSSVSGDIATFNGTSGGVIQDSGILASSLAVGPGTSIARQIPVFSGTDGKTLTNSLAEVDTSGNLLAGDNGSLTNAAFAWVGAPSTGFLLDPTQGGSTNALVTSIQGQQAVVINLDTGNNAPYSQHNFRVLFQDGGQYNPALGFFNNGGLGWFRDATNSIMTTIGGVPTIAFRANGIDIVNVGSGLSVAEGSNARQGIATLATGTVTVANTSVTANSRIFLTVQSLGTVTAPWALAVSARVPGASFTILSAAVTDTSVVAYEIFEPG